MMSTRRDLYLLMLTYSNHKGPLDASDLQRFLEVEQKVRAPPMDGARLPGAVEPVHRVAESLALRVPTSASSSWTCFSFRHGPRQHGSGCFPRGPLSGWGSSWFLP